MKYRKRIIDELLDRKLKTFGATLIVGPKGCGKTTSAKRLAKTTIEFQDEDARDNYLSVANIVPSKLLENEKPILFDEWQDAPKIWGAIRKSCDDIGKTGLYILTGSSSQDINTPHTGTGRISTLTMYPMSLYESGESNGSVSLSKLFENPESFENCRSDLTIDDLIFAICRGGWPRALDIKKEFAFDISQDIFYQTCHRDICEIDHTKRDSQIAKKLLKSYSRNIATLANNKTIYSDITSNLEISRPTYYDYELALQKLFIIDNIPAWCPSIRSKDAIRSTIKRNLIDPSIAVAALGISPQYFNNDFKTLGFLFESLCFRDLRIYSSKILGEMSYYHDRYGLEADGVLHLQDGKYALLEFKLGSNEIDEGAKHLCKIESLIQEYNKKEKQVPLRNPDLKIIVTGAKYGYRREDGVLVIPLACLRD